MTENKKISAKILKDAIVKEIVSLNHGRPGDSLLRPNMAVVMIGEDKSSFKFLEKLDKEAVKVGIDTHVYKCPSESDEEEVKAIMDCLNDDELMDGIYLQSPLPDNFKEEDILGLIKSEKDLNYVLEGDDGDLMQQAKLFKGAMDNFKSRRIEEL